MHPKYLKIEDFTYNLPEEKIAEYPLTKRDSSKLLIYKNGKISESSYTNLAKHLPPETLLVLNNTRVVEARLLFKKPSGTTIEIFCLEPNEQPIPLALMQTQRTVWKCLVGNAKKWKEECLQKEILYNNHALQLTVKIIEKRNDYFLVEFSWNNDAISFAEILHLFGAIPLPPYIHRAAEEKDATTYQTVYAKYNGSVAAPTAGLHFTENVLQQLKTKNISTAFVTLHVGAGTFKPVKAVEMGGHEMHAELIDVSTSFITQLIDTIETHPVVAVGTTSLRTIETLYWMGVKISEMLNMKSEKNSNTSHISLLTPYISVYQWDAYELPATLTARESLQILLDWMKQNNLKRLITKTQIIIAPSYQFKIAKGLITNFHQPKSTLLLLVSALIGDDWKKVYDYALSHQFRFLSYGDGSLLWGNSH
jgi:S-adenosylmethionine:tRNA-ribosyltransferase-isomerase (queuine synthetase)